MSTENKIFPIIMNKNILRNFNYLKKLGKNARGDAIPKVNQIIELYSSRKISQVQTAENMIMNFLKSNTDKQQKSVNTKYDKLIEKHQVVETLSNRLRQKTTVRNNKKEKRINAANKIQKITRGAVVFEVEEISKAKEK